MRFVLKAENGRRAAGERDEIISEKASSPTPITEKGEKDAVYSTVEEAKMDKGDMWSGFTYAL